MKNAREWRQAGEVPDRDDTPPAVPQWDGIHRDGEGGWCACGSAGEWFDCGRCGASGEVEQDSYELEMDGGRCPDCGGRGFYWHCYEANAEMLEQFEKAFAAAPAVFDAPPPGDRVQRKPVVDDGLVRSVFIFRILAPADAAAPTR